MAKYRKRPLVIEAIQWTGDNWEEIKAFCPSVYEPEDVPFIPTLEGDMTLCLNDWVIKGIKGEFYPCKPDIFAETYESLPDYRTIP
jgi:hypothetical protein